MSTMTHRLRRLRQHLLLCSCLLLIAGFSASVHSEDDQGSHRPSDFGLAGLEWSGFARSVAGYLESDGSSFNGYRDNIRVNQQSLLALQPSYHVSDQLSLTGQFVAHSSDDRDSGTEWLYLNYQPSDAWQLRAGKLRMPFFSYSDSIDVGFSYPWITAPVQVYNNYLFSTFHGASASYRRAGLNYALDIEGYYGYFDGDIFAAGSRVDVDAEVKDLRGIVVKLRSHNIGLRLSYHQGENETDLPELQPLQQGLQQAGFNNLANDLDSKGTIRVSQAALSYDGLTSFYKAEWVKTRTEFSLTPEFTGYYFTAGLHIGSWTPHLTYASSSYGRVRSDTALQPVLADPQNPLFPIAAGYYQIFDAIPDGSMDSYTLGLRWDFQFNMAFKAELTWLNETAPRSGFIEPPSSGLFGEDFGNRKAEATLYQLGWEWIF